MIQSCGICKEKYSTEYRNWYDRYVPWTCTSRCFHRFLMETVESIVTPAIEDDRRITRFFSPVSTHLRSGYEREFRSWLEREKIPFEYEPYSFTLSNKKRYVPDFLVNERYFVEVKGLWNSESKKKFLMMTKEFYDLPIVVVDRGFLNMLKRKGKARG